MAVVRRRVELPVNIFSVRQCAYAANCSRSALADFYYPSIVRQMVECIKVHNDGRLTIIFGGGYEIEETL